MPADSAGLLFADVVKENIMRKYLLAVSIVCGLLAGCASPGNMGMQQQIETPAWVTESGTL